MKTFKQIIATYKPKQPFVSKSGAGEDGRSETVEKYQKDTPGQTSTK